MFVKSKVTFVLGLTAKHVCLFAGCRFTESILMKHGGRVVLMSFHLRNDAGLSDDFNPCLGLRMS